MNKEGTGLGLAIAKQIADRHGISLGVTSKVGVGTEFTASFK
jgi:signal transduction histidine kinase